MAGIYPPLAGSEWVAGEKETLVKIVLHGLTGPLTVGDNQFGVRNPIPMPPMGLDDQQTADVLTYIRSNFGNQSEAVSAAEVARIRAAAGSRANFWTIPELQSPEGH